MLTKLNKIALFLLLATQASGNLLATSPAASPEIATITSQPSTEAPRELTRAERFNNTWFAKTVNYASMKAAIPLMLVPIVLIGAFTYKGIKDLSALALNKAVKTIKAHNNQPATQNIPENEFKTPVRNIHNT